MTWEERRQFLQNAPFSAEVGFPGRVLELDLGRYQLDEAPLLSCAMSQSYSVTSAFSKCRQLPAVRRTSHHIVIV